MKLFRKIFKPDEIKSVLDVLNEAEHSFNSPAFCLISENIKGAISKYPERVVDMVRSDKSPRQTVFIMIANIAGDEVESGKHHLYRGVLNPLGYGSELLKIYYLALDELVKMGHIDEEEAEENRLGIKENIKSVG